MARSTCSSQNAKNMRWSGRFFRKMARSCGENRVPSQNVHFQVKNMRGLGPLSEVHMSKNCTPLWCEAHASQNAKNVRCSGHCLKFRRRKKHAAVAQSEFSSQNAECTKHLRFASLLDLAMWKRCPVLS